MANTQLAVFKENAVAKFGKDFLKGLIIQAANEEKAVEAMNIAQSQKQFLQFELTKAVLASAYKDESLNPHAIMSGTGAVRALNDRVLAALGVKESKEDELNRKYFVWTDRDVANLYEYTKELKESDEAEYTRRFNNRKRLNMQISNACKAAAYLKDNKVQPSDMMYNEDGNAVLHNAPKEIAGVDKSEVVIGERKVREGAAVSPTMAGIVRLATAGKPSKAKVEATTSDPKMGMSDAAFGEIANTLIKAIRVQEGKISDQQRKTLVAVQAEIAKVLK